MTVRSDSAECCTISRYSRWRGFELGVEHQLGHADHAVHRRADLVAHVGQELALGPIGRLGRLTRDVQVPDQPEPDDSQADLAGRRFQGGEHGPRGLATEADREDSLEVRTVGEGKTCRRHEDGIPSRNGLGPRPGGPRLLEFGGACRDDSVDERLDVLDVDILRPGDGTDLPIPGLLVDDPDLYESVEMARQHRGAALEHGLGRFFARQDRADLRQHLGEPRPFLKLGLVPLPGAEVADHADGVPAIAEMECRDAQLDGKPLAALANRRQLDRLTDLGFRPAVAREGEHALRQLQRSPAGRGSRSDFRSSTSSRRCPKVRSAASFQ